MSKKNKKLTVKLADWFGGISKPEWCVFGAIFLCLTAKYLLLTKFTTDTTDFLNSYRFVASDSYDWLANGIRFLTNDSISFRNPGLVLIIRALYNLHALYILPLLGNLAFFLLVVYVYRLCRLVSSRTVALVIAAFVALNYTLNLAANFILADMYAVSFLAVSLYYLLIKKYPAAFFLIGLSMLFQNMAYMLLIIWVGYYLLQNAGILKSKLAAHDVNFFVRQGLLICMYLLPVIAWHVFKLIKFGDLLYESKTNHLSLLRLHFDSVYFYLQNVITIFGLSLFGAAGYFIWRAKRFSQNRMVQLLVVGALFNALFWVFLYDWDDRRFLLYFVPFLYPLMALFLQAINRRWHVAAIAIALFTFYPTILPVSSFLAANEVPIAHSLYLTTGDTGSTQHNQPELHSRDGFEHPVMDLNPILYFAYINRHSYRLPGHTKYSFYKRYIELNYDQASNSICVDTYRGISRYVVSTVLQIDKNVDLTKLRLLHNCHAKL